MALTTTYKPHSNNEATGTFRPIRDVAGQPIVLTGTVVFSNPGHGGSTILIFPGHPTYGGDRGFMPDRFADQYRATPLAVGDAVEVYISRDKAKRGKAHANDKYICAYIHCENQARFSNPATSNSSGYYGGGEWPPITKAAATTTQHQQGGGGEWAGMAAAAAAAATTTTAPYPRQHGYGSVAEAKAPSEICMADAVEAGFKVARKSKRAKKAAGKRAAADSPPPYEDCLVGQEAAAAPAPAPAAPPPSPPVYVQARAVSPAAFCGACGFRYLDTVDRFCMKCGVPRLVSTL
jgi:hypothetical protein